MTIRMFRTSITSVGTHKLLVRKGRRSKNRILACALIQKLNQVASRRRTIERNLKSVSALLDGRFRVAHRIESDTDCGNQAADVLDFGCRADQEEDLVPQQLWDHLFDSAFQAIGNADVDIFD